MNTQRIISILALTASLSLVGASPAQARENDTRHSRYAEKQGATDSHQHPKQGQNNNRRHEEPRYDSRSRQHNRKEQPRHRRVAVSPRVHRHQHKRGILHHHPIHYVRPHKSWRRHHARWGHQNSRRHVRNDTSHDYYQRRRDFNNRDRYNYKSRYY